MVLSLKHNNTIRQRIVGQHSDEVKKQYFWLSVFLFISWFWWRGVYEHISSVNAPTVKTHAKTSHTRGFSMLDFQEDGHNPCLQLSFLWLVRDDSTGSESYGTLNSQSRAKPQRSCNSPLWCRSTSNCSLLWPFLISATYSKARNDKYRRYRLCKKLSKEISSQTIEMLEIMRKLRATGEKKTQTMKFGLLLY